MGRTLQPCFDRLTTQFDAAWIAKVDGPRTTATEGKKGSGQMLDSRPARFEVQPSDRDPRGFRLIGEIDISNADQLIDSFGGTLRTQGDLTLDLSGVAFMDSTGIKALIQLSQALGKAGRLRLISPGSAVARVLELVRVETFPNVVVVEQAER